MRLVPGVLVALFLLSLLSGCFGEQDGDFSASDKGDATGTDGPVAITNETQTTAAEEFPTRSERFDLRELDFDHELKRWELVAHSELVYNASWEIAVGDYRGDEDCAALAFHPQGEPNQNGSLALVAWAWRNNVARTEWTLDGQRDSIGTHEYDNLSGGFPLQGEGYSSGRLAAGQKIIIEIGGRTTDFAHAQYTHPDTPSQTNDNRFRMNLTYQGDAELKPLEAAPLRCGASPEQANDATFGIHNHAHVVVDGTIRMDTQRASTLLVQDNPSLLDDAARDYRAQFLGETYEQPTSLERTSDEAGTIALNFDTWVGETPTNPLWFMADTNWPWIEGESGR